MNFKILAVFLFQSFFLVLGNQDLKTVDQKALPEANITHESSTQENATSTVLLKENKTLPIDSIKNTSLGKDSVQVQFHNTTIAPNTTVSPPVSTTTPSSTTAKTSSTINSTTVSPNATTPTETTTTPVVPTTNTTNTTTPLVPTSNITTTTAPSNTHNATQPVVVSTSVLPEISTPVPQSRQFDGPSFIGGIVLTVGLTAIGFIAFKFYKADRVPKSENYRQL